MYIFPFYGNFTGRYGEQKLVPPTTSGTLEPESLAPSGRKQHDNLKNNALVPFSPVAASRIAS